MTESHAPSSSALLQQQQQPSSTTSSSSSSSKLIYAVRHAQALHNVKEQEAIRQAKQVANSPTVWEQARKAVLQDPSLRDAPLSPPGVDQVKEQSNLLSLLNQQGGHSYPPPQIVLVSPLRRTLETATELFYSQHHRNDDEEEHDNERDNRRHTQSHPRFVALEILREKRTGFSADERSPVPDLEQQFPHVDFSDLKRDDNPPIEPGEDNASVQRRAQHFLDHVLPALPETVVAFVTHKGWLREMRHVLTKRVQAGQLQHNIDGGEDICDWDRHLYQNAEIRIAKCIWEGSCRGPFTSLFSKSVETALRETIDPDTPRENRQDGHSCEPQTLFRGGLDDTAATAATTTTALGTGHLGATLDNATSTLSHSS